MLRYGKGCAETLAIELTAHSASAVAGDGRLARHAHHHSRAHMKAMKVAISNGLNFDQAHRWALLRVGR